MILPLVPENNAILRRHADSVLELTPGICRLIDDMAETMYASNGCGLAAPQVGHSLRICVVDVAPPDKRSDLRVFLNPALVDALDEDANVESAEGCLSLPGDNRVYTVWRHSAVRVSALYAPLKNRLFSEWHATWVGQTLCSRPSVIQLDGRLAIAVQHEVDHLNGILVCDRAKQQKPKGKT